MANSLHGRVAVIFGLANKRSIAWAIAQKLHQEGAEIAITYQNERLRLEAEDMIQSLPGATGFQCDVSKDEEIAEVFRQIGERYHGKIHTLVHSVAYAPAEDLKNDFLLTSREGFRIAQDVSVYSLIAISRAGVGSLGDFLKVVQERSPLKRNVDVAEVGATAAFLATDGAAGITGEVIHVDCGYNVMGY